MKECLVYTNHEILTYPSLEQTSQCQIQHIQVQKQTFISNTIHYALLVQRKDHSVLPIQLTPTPTGSSIIRTIYPTSLIYIIVHMANQLEFAVLIKKLQLLRSNSQMINQFVNNNSLIMKQRKKIKYVQKQPPDKTNPVNNYNQPKEEKPSQNQPFIANKYQKEIKVESSNPTNQTYLISTSQTNHHENLQKERNSKKQENKPKYVLKEEKYNDHQHQKVEKVNQKSDYSKNSYKRNKEEVPRTYERQSSRHDQICIICSQQILRKDWIWSCICCCISMHLKCIKQWIQNINQQLDRKAMLILNWKCPQCNYEYNEPMPKYYCYCGKHLNPEFDRDLEPHSCGQICSKKRGANCPHPCPSVCHSGKCKPCDYEGSLVTCQCGKSERLVKCSEQRLLYQCGKKCQKILNCHNHKCERNCHTGQCMPCKKKHMVSCYCGKSDDIIDCALPSYSCEQICKKKLNCGYHYCEEKCHLGNCNQCHKTPQLQKTCPCGKYDIEMLTGDPDYRKSCEDSIPVCGMPCSKKLDCGHICPGSCHQGNCPQCKVLVDQNCICGLQSRKIQCWKKNKQPYKCESICKKKRSCGQHLCNEVCCKFRNSPILDNHPCQLSCTKMLNCNKHECGEACHLGLCKKCPVIYSQPQPCPCGKTSLKPPIVCGTIVPQCDNLCDKQLACGHLCKNSCHYGPCKCYENVVVSCRCGKQNIQTICGRQALCLNKCKQILECGHKCDLQCHKGSCQEAHKSAPCRKICSKQRKDCHHFCPQLCHPGQICESFSCQAQILVKCDCGHRQTMSLCGAHDNHKTKKGIVCNKKCQNLKRFDMFYKDKQAYYPGNLIQLAFKNYTYLQNLQNRLQKFILHSDQSFIEIQYKFTDNNTKLFLTNLFQNHYHLNTHFYRYRKYAAFTLMQSQYTMVPKPVLTQYMKLISKGVIKQSNLPFQFTISFECEQKQKSDLIIKNLKQFLHKYYSQRNSRFISLHFWNKQDGEEALKFLQNQYQLMEFRCSYNINKVEEEVGENQIIQSQVKQQEQEKQKPIELKKKQDLSIQPIPQNKVETNVEQKALKQQVKTSTEQVTKKIPGQNTSSKLIIRKGVPNFKKNDYPQSKENIQDIYLLDQDELYNEKINWQQFVSTLCSKKMGPEATQWRIRSLFIINSFHNISDHILHQQFDNIIKMYNKDKESAMRILQIQRIQNKSVKKEMGENGIYLSDHQPEILAYLQLFNYLSQEKIALELPQIVQNTPEITKVHEILSALQQKDTENFFHHFNSADYVMSCAMIPLVHEIREIILEEIRKGGKITTKNLYKYLLFKEQSQFIQYAQQNGLIIESRISKTTKQEVYYLKSRVVNKNFIKNNEFMTSIYEKRDRKYFLVQPEELVKENYMTRTFFAFGDFKQSVSPKYIASLVKLLKQKS